MFKQNQHYSKILVEFKLSIELQNIACYAGLLETPSKQAIFAIS